MIHRKNHHWLFNLVLILIVAGVYFLAAKLGLSLAFLNASVSPVWPPTGVAIAFVFWLGYRTVPGVFLGALLANSLLTNVPFAIPDVVANGAWVGGEFAKSAARKTPGTGRYPNRNTIARATPPVGQTG